MRGWMLDWPGVAMKSPIRLPFGTIEAIRLPISTPELKRS
jgi:hypothetical protein